MLSVERRQQRRQPVIAGVALRADADDAVAMARETAHVLFGALDVAEHTAGGLEHPPAGRGEHHAAAEADEERRAEPRLDVAQLVAVDIDAPGKQEQEIRGGRDGERTPARVGRDEQAEKDGENEEGALVFRQQRAGEAERRESEGPAFVRDHPAAGCPDADAEDERKR